VRPVAEAAAVAHLGAARHHPGHPGQRGRNLVQVIRHGLKKIKYQPGLIEGCLAGTGLTFKQAGPPADITNWSSF